MGGQGATMAHPTAGDYEAVHNAAISSRRPYTSFFNIV
jgi:hypothetical protein